jgi:hypothetical protein
MRDENGVCPADNEVEHGYPGQIGCRIPAGSRVPR